jgi:hypothetical protein
MPKTSSFTQPAIPTGRIIAGALPAILLLLCYLWLADGIITWMLSSILVSFIGHGGAVMTAVGVIFALPALYLSWQTCRTAIAGERDALAETGSVELG